MTKTTFFVTLFFLVNTMLFQSCASIPKANRALGQLHLGKPQQAWRMISEELENPSVSSQQDLCELHLATLQILKSIIPYDFVPPDADEIAKRSYDYIQSHCGAFQSKIIAAENQYGLFFLNTQRPGLSIPHFKKALTLSPKDSYLQMCNEHNLSLVYADMGKFDLRDYFRLRALETGKGYFKKRRTYKFSLDEFNEFNSYKNILELRLNDLSWGNHNQGRLDEMHRIWNDIEPINAKWYSKSTQFLAYTTDLQYFASVGDTSFARKLLAEAKGLIAKHPYSNSGIEQLDLQSAEAKILLHEGRFNESAGMYRSWIDNFEKVTGKSLDGNSYRLAGLAQEAAGEYGLAAEYLEKSIERFEAMRSSFDVKSRGQVLSGLVVTSYWGLIRSYARRYVKNKNETYFQGALKAARLLRARQFGELIQLNDDLNNRIDPYELKLAPDELLLNIVMTDRAMVMFALTSSRHDLFVIPCKNNDIESMVKAVKTALLDSSGPNAYIANIQALSNMIISPVQTHLNGIKKIIIIPDGSLNAIPLTLLSKRQDRYYPLILDHEIVYTPSIAYLMKQKNTEFKSSGSHHILAMADPAFKAPNVPESYNDESAHFYKRAVEDFNLFLPLPETRKEVENIASLFKRSEVDTLYGDRATESKLKTLSLSQYRYLHFATHGVLGNQIPGIDEPALVLAGEREGSPEDGFLTLGEVESLTMNCELTVLSACDTGSGEYFTGEGVMGLSRGFLVAGSRSVIVSLWPVASQETVELMTLFYRNLRSGKSKAESLRLAQLAMLKGKRTQTSINRGLSFSSGKSSKKQNMHPYYWAPFILIGE